MNPAALRLTAALWPIAGVGLLLVILLVQGWPPAERATLLKLSERYLPLRTHSGYACESAVRDHGCRHTH